MVYLFGLIPDEITKTKLCAPHVTGDGSSTEADQLGVRTRFFVMPRIIIPVEERFWSKVDRNGPIPSHVPELGNCWIWTSHTCQSKNSNFPYGYFTLNGKECLAHRVCWILSNGEFNRSLCVLHKCDNSVCVRPDHLFLGTLSDNAKDAVAKGRMFICSGEKSGKAKLKSYQVVEIKERLARKETHWSIAVRFGVTRAAITRINMGLNWASVS